jgi:hypothetical protein
MVPEFGRLGVRTADGQLLRFLSTQDKKKHTLHLQAWRNNHSAELSYRQPDNEHLVLSGTVDGKPVQVHLHRVRPGQSLLKTRGFH